MIYDRDPRASGWPLAVMVLWLLAILTVAACPAQSSDIARLDVTPRQMPVPSRVTLRGTIPPAAENRVICYGVDGAEFQAGCREWPGLDAPTRIEVTFLVRAGGPYTAFLEVQDAAGRARVRVPVSFCALEHPGDGDLCF